MRILVIDDERNINRLLTMSLEADDHAVVADLYYRLNVVTLHLPPLRERPLDLERLAAAHLRFFVRRAGKPIRDFSPEAKAALRRSVRPGNLRELRNAIERAVILSPGPLIEPEHLTRAAAPPHAGRPEMEVGGAVTLAALTDEHVRRVLSRSARLEDAAEILGIDVATLYRKRRKWQQHLLEQGSTEV